MSRKVHPWFALFLVVGSWPTTSKGQLQVPETVAREIWKRFATHFDGIETLQFRFHTTVKYLHRPDDSKNWQDFEYRDAFYAYDTRAGQKYLSGIDTNYGRTLRKQEVQLPSESRLLQKDETGVFPTEGFVNQHVASTWDVYGPEVFVRIKLLKKFRSNVEKDNYRVDYSNGPGSDPEISVGLGPARPEDSLREGFHFRIKLDAGRGFAPYEFRHYMKGNLVRVISLELFEAAPGIYLPERGMMKGWLPEDPNVEFYEGEFRMDKESVRVNEPIAQSLFDLRFPEGTQVSDNIRGTSYTQGLKPGQATPQRVIANAEHARHIAPVIPIDEQQNQAENAEPIPDGIVRARYGSRPWYSRLWVWTLGGSIAAAAIASYIFQMRRAA